MAKEPSVALQADSPASTQVRILTPLATGAIAVIQVAGPQALSLARTVFRPRSGKTLADYPLDRIVYGDFLNDDGTVLDDGLASRGDSAGQPRVEFNPHGGVRIVQRLVRRLAESGARLVTQDLAHGPAEHIPPNATTPADHAFDWLPSLDQWMQQCLAEAATPQVVRWLTQQAALWRVLLADWRMLLAAGDPEVVRRQSEALLAKADLGGLWRGRTLAIIGLPNAGKSSIANRLAGRNVSLVADAPGTTRDWVAEPIALGGWPVHIVDTAGLRETDDPVEAEGVARAMAQALGADLRLFVIDTSCPPSGSEDLLIGRVGPKSSDVVAYAKSDLPPGRLLAAGSPGIAAGLRTVHVSAATGAGWSELERALLDGFGYSALHEPHPQVFCPWVHMGVARLVSALGARRWTEALAVLDSLAPAD